MNQFNHLEEILKSLEREPWYRVRQVLKKSPYEETQLVDYPTPNGISGPYIRKYIKCEYGEPSVYETLYIAQHQGVGFAHTPKVLECYHNEQNLVVVMEMIAGPTLEKLIRDSSDVGTVAAHLFPKICDAATELHVFLPQSIIHRDIKPSNIIITSDGPGNANAILIDFGISRIHKQGAKNDTVFAGTTSYAPPEQYGFGQTDERSDIYALGCTLYYMLTKQEPSLTIQQESRPQCVSKAEWDVIIKATRLNQDHRYQNVEELKSAAVAALSWRVSLWKRIRDFFGNNTDSHKATNTSNGVKHNDNPPCTSISTPSQNQNDNMRATRQQSTGTTQRAIPGLLWNAFLLLLFACILIATFDVTLGSRQVADVNPIVSVIIGFGVISIPCGLLMLILADLSVLETKMNYFVDYKAKRLRIRFFVHAITIAFTSIAIVSILTIAFGL